MDDKAIRKIVQDEIRRGASKSRFGLQMPQNHAHTGIDGSPQIQANNILPSASITGFVSFAQAQTYTIKLNAAFTPRTIIAYGIATGVYNTHGVRVSTTGTAQLTPTFYLQDPTDAGTPDDYVVTGKLQFPFASPGTESSASGKPAQSSSFFAAVRDTNEFYAGVSEDHLVSIYFPSTSNILARATVTSFSKDAITIDIPVLAEDWEITINFVIS